MRRTSTVTPLLGVLTLLLGLVGSGYAKEPYRRVLISSSRSMNVDPNLFLRDVTVGRYITPDCGVPWSIRMYTYTGGKQQGTQVIWIDNDEIQICVIPTRGMGIYSVLHKNNRVLGWDSPVRELVHPSMVNLEGRGGLGWLDGFNEWLCRCGMEWNGQAGKDQFTNNMGERAEMDLTLHGRIANLPAQEVELIVQRDPPYQLTVRGVVHERMLHGPKLELTSEISTLPKSRSFRINDAVTNRGGSRQEFQMLYHTNFGPPILEDGAKLLAPVEVVTPFNEHASKGVEKYDQFNGPQAGTIEQVYAIQPLADPKGRTTILLRNKSGDLGAAMRYDTHELPFLTLWKNLAAPEDGYVTGIEPGTNYPNNRRVERKHGRVPTLSPGESHYMAIDFSIVVGTEEVQQVTQEVAKIQGNRRPLFNQQPEKHE